MATWKDFFKKAQVDDFGWPAAAVAFMPKSKYRDELEKYYKPGGSWELAKQMADSAVLEGVSQGAQEAIPGFIDLIGSLGGGIGGGLGSWSGGGSFTDGFSKGWNSGAEDIKPGSDNIRKWIGSIGGNAVNRLIREGFTRAADKYYRDYVGPDTDNHGKPTDEAVRFAHDLNSLSSAREGAKSFTKLVAQWPLFGAPLKGLMGLLGTGGKAVGTVTRAAGEMSRVSRAAAPVVNAVATKAAPFANAARTAYGAVGPVARPMAKGMFEVASSPIPYGAMAADISGAGMKTNLTKLLAEHMGSHYANADAIEKEIEAMNSPLVSESEKEQHWNRYEDLKNNLNVGGFIPTWWQYINR
jgi:hypothetical protein